MTWRWIPPITADGPTQMAIDRWMLDQLESGPGASMLRLYRWSRPTLSLGRHQQRLEPHWFELQARGLIDLVRRPSGGRAVLHAGELTYALVQRPASLRREQVYRQACRWLIEAFAEFQQPLQFGTGPSAAAQSRQSCFATATAADLVQADGVKRIGSAQLWRSGLVLQHGSLLLDPPVSLWNLVFGTDPPAVAALPLEPLRLEACLRAAAQRHLCGGCLEEHPLTPGEWQQVQRLRQDPG